MHIVVLGGGFVGSAVVRDLAESGYRVTLADRDPTALKRAEAITGGAVALLEADLSEPSALASAVADATLVVGAVPGFMGFETVRGVLEAGKAVVDICFFPEDAFELDGLARGAGVPCLVDCGVAPGISNLILGRHEADMDETTRFACYVGGLPVERGWPFEYKASFSPTDIIEEYLRPARLRIDGREVVRPALSEVEAVDIPGLGTLEAFNTDGLRSLLRTSSTPTLIEKTMRYPGHADRMRMLRDIGFLSREVIETTSGAVRPRDLAERLLFEAWKYGEGEADLTVMRIEVDGVEEGAPVRHVYEMLDRYDPVTDTSSMARTTGYACTAIVHLVASELWTDAGVAPLEMVGRRADCFDAALAHLAERDVRFDHSVEML